VGKLNPFLPFKLLFTCFGDRLVIVLSLKLKKTLRNRLNVITWTELNITYYSKIAISSAAPPHYVIICVLYNIYRNLAVPWFYWGISLYMDAVDGEHWLIKLPYCKLKSMKTYWENDLCFWLWT